MATRYIWGKYNKTSDYTLSWGYDYFFTRHFVNEGETWNNSDNYPISKIYYGTSFTILDNSNSYVVKIKLNNPTVETFSKNIRIPAGNVYASTDTFYVIRPGLSNMIRSINSLVEYSSALGDVCDILLNLDEIDSMEDDWYDGRYKYTIGMYARNDVIVYYNDYNNVFPNPAQLETTNAKGSFIGYVSSTSKSTYPTKGVSGLYWYEYITSDTISDPTAISITSNPLIAGSYANYSITSSATAGSYGSITYHIAFAYDDGSSYALMTFNTNKTGQVLLPSYATKNIRLRVYVSDGIGYTSTVNVYSQWYPISTYTSFVGVSNVAKGATSYVGVGGIAKSAIAKKGIGSNVK